MKTTGKALIFLMLWAMCMICIDLSAQKPKAVNDTFPWPRLRPVYVATDSGGIWLHKSRPWNVLANDSDPNGDPLTVTSFNGHYFNSADSVVIADVGTFYLEVNGTFRTKLIGEIRGTWVFTYRVNDGKRGLPTEGTVIYRRE